MESEIGTYHGRHQALMQGERLGPKTLSLNHLADRQGGRAGSVPMQLRGTGG